jgi:hypothetical protein
MRRTLSAHNDYLIDLDDLDHLDSKVLILVVIDQGNCAQATCPDSPAIGLAISTRSSLAPVWPRDQFKPGSRLTALDCIAVTSAVLKGRRRPID